MRQVTIPNEILEAEVIYVSHSGGKDSQAMLAYLNRANLLHKAILVHADLGDMEWEPMHNWINKNSFGLDLNIVQSEYDFFSLCRKYKRLPSGCQQFCTDFLKYIPIESFIHDHMNKHGYTKAINATGMRSEESKRRAKYSEVEKSKMQRPKKFPNHKILDWRPILSFRLDDVLKEISNAGQEIHPVYAQGFSRLSCVFCVNGRIEEHKKAAELRPELAQKMIQLEKDLGKTLRLKQVNKIKLPKYLEEYINQ